MALDHVQFTDRFGWPLPPKLHAQLVQCVMSAIAHPKADIEAVLKRARAIARRAAEGQIEDVERYATKALFAVSRDASLKRERQPIVCQTPQRMDVLAGPAKDAKSVLAGGLFQLARKEDEALRSQIVTSNVGAGRGDRRYPPDGLQNKASRCFLRYSTNKRAIEVNIAIMRTFVRLRQLLAIHEELARRLGRLEWRQKEEGQQIQVVFEQFST